MKLTVEQRLDSFQHHMELREGYLTVEENREFLNAAIVDLQARLKALDSHPDHKTKVYVEALRAVQAWRGLDGDGISDPVRAQVDDALKLAE